MNTTQLLPRAEAQDSLPKIVKAASVEPCRTSSGSMRVLLDSLCTGGALTLVEASLMPGEGQSCQTHTREDKIILVQSGRFEVCIGNTTVHLGPGDSAFAPRGLPHAFLCTGGEPGTLDVWAVGAGCEELLLLEDRIAGGDEPPAARLEAARRLGIVLGAPEVLEEKPLQEPQVLQIAKGKCLPLLDGPKRLLCTGDVWLEEIETSPLCGPSVVAHEDKDLAFLILAGRYEFCISDARALVEPGDAVWVPHSVPLGWRAISATPARMVQLGALARA